MVAVLLILLFGIGLLILGYMVVVKPQGTLTVTYQLQQYEKTCPQCAEHIKAAALVCRFCGYKFDPASIPFERVEQVYRGYTYATLENGEAELKLSSGEWRKYPSTEFLKAYVNAITRHRRYGPDE